MAQKVSMPKHMGRIYLLIILGLFIYALVVLGVAVYNNLIFADLDIGFLQKNGKPSDMVVSFIASALESFWFFLCSGLVVIALTMSRPEDKDFETKLYYLFPRVNQTTKGKEYCRKSINRLACISPVTKVTISVDAYSDEFEAFRVSTDHEYHLLNLHNNIAFSDDLRVKHKLTDANPEDFGCKHWGQIKRVRTISNHSNPNDSKSLLSLPEALCDIESGFEFPVHIAPNDHLILDISSWTWNKFLSPLNSSVSRFTEKLEMTIVNHSGRDLMIIDYQKGEQGIMFPDGETYDLYDNVAIPGEPISYKLQLNK